MFGSLTQLASRPFMVGFVLPVLIACVIGYYLFSDVEFVATLKPFVMQSESWDKIAYLAVTVWAIALFLSMTSNAQYRLLEGYSWPVNHFQHWEEKERRRYCEDEARVAAYKAKRKKATPEEVAGVDAALTKSFAKLRREFPQKDSALMPTRFGNQIRAFESYSSTVYGADAVMLWFSLSAVLPKDYQEALNNARSNVDFLVNLIFLFVGLAILAAARIGYFIYLETIPLDGAFLLKHVWLIVGFVILLVAARWAYLFSLSVLFPWGELVKGAFDNYLPALAKQWGYEVPKTWAERKSFWTQVSQQLTYHEPLKPENWLPKPSREHPRSFRIRT